MGTEIIEDVTEVKQFGLEEDSKRFIEDMRVFFSRQ
jgi:hypothetical protein